MSRLKLGGHVHVSFHIGGAGSPFFDLSIEKNIFTKKSELMSFVVSNMTSEQKLLIDGRTEYYIFGSGCDDHNNADLLKPFYIKDK